MFESIFLLTFVLSQVFFFLATGRKASIFLFILPWSILTGILAFYGFFSNTVARPPRFTLVFIGSILLCVVLIRLMRYDKINVNYLLSVHVMRIPVELVLYQQYLMGKVPELMTFAGWNFDIIMGISALLLLIYKMVTGKEIGNRFLLWWNGIGILFLTSIVAMAVLASPTPIQLLAFHQPNVAVLEFPYVWLPSVIVPIVFMAHWFGIKVINF